MILGCLRSAALMEHTTYAVPRAVQAVPPLTPLDDEQVGPATVRPTSKNSQSAVAAEEAQRLYLQGHVETHRFESLRVPGARVGPAAPAELRLKDPRKNARGLTLKVGDGQDGHQIPPCLQPVSGRRGVDPDKGVVTVHHRQRSAHVKLERMPEQRVALYWKVPPFLVDHPSDYQPLPGRRFGAVRGRGGVGCAEAPFESIRGDCQGCAPNT